LVEFRVGRGHDGPARVGEYILGSTTFATPLLASSFTSSDSIIAYGALGRDNPLSEKPMLVTLPLVSQVDEIPLTNIRESDAVILPSMISLASIGPEAPHLVFDYQLEVLSRIKQVIVPSKTIIRIMVLCSLSMVN
jgi:hypothetical protein